MLASLGVIPAAKLMNNTAMVSVNDVFKSIRHGVTRQLFSMSLLPWNMVWDMADDILMDAVVEPVAWAIRRFALEEL